jgi:hypothetical protein
MLSEGLLRLTETIILITLKYNVFQKELYNGIPNVSVWRVSRKPLHLKAYKLSIVQGAERWIVATQ